MPLNGLILSLSFSMVRQFLALSPLPCHDLSKPSNDIVWGYKSYIRIFVILHIFNVRDVFPVECLRIDIFIFHESDLLRFVYTLTETCPFNTYCGLRSNGKGPIKHAPIWV